MEPQFIPSRTEFRDLTQRGNVIPVYADLIADSETPVSAFSKLDRGGCSFLFESTEKNDVSGRFSFVGTDPRIVIRSRDDEIEITERSETRKFRSSSDPLSELRHLMAQYQFVARPELPRFVGGAVGFLGYDATRFFEPTVPAAERDDLNLPEMLFMITGAVLIFDHRLRTVRILNNAFLTPGDDTDKTYDDACKGICDILERLKLPENLPPLDIHRPITPLAGRSNMSREEFERSVNQTKDYITRGDIFQLVLSRRVEVDFNKDPLGLYRCLRFVNPSPYMFCLNFGAGFSLVGSSPEMHVRAVDGLVEIRPIAGTRKRGQTQDEDEQNALELLADAKERAEHVMLLDLARNDVGRIAQFGSVRVTEKMDIERYSHVMHIASHVVARLRADKDAYDVLRATFPAGTVSGAPKVRAMQLICDLEKNKRGCYAGVVGYFGFDGNLDSCITLRSIVLKNRKAYIQAGAGIVADSTPAGEYDETENKAAAMMQALQMASDD
ncbi:MAG: anthranilate synthase component [Verrucomicrobiota bacterium]